jgi:hypothetical protein
VRWVTRPLLGHQQRMPAALAGVFHAAMRRKRCRATNGQGVSGRRGLRACLARLAQLGKVCVLQAPSALSLQLRMELTAAAGQQRLTALGWC